MRTKISVVVASILGVFLLYCGQSAVNILVDGGGGDGGVRDAHAADGSCCSPSFTKIAEGTLAKEASSDEMDLSSYNEIIVFHSPPGCFDQLTATYYPVGSTEFYLSYTVTKSRMLTHGPRMRLRN